MRLYWNDALIDPMPDDGAVEKALERLRLEDGAALELRGSADGAMRVTHRLNEGYFMDVQDGGSLFGLLVPEDEVEAVGAALLEFRRGSRPRLPWELVQQRPGGGAEFVAGDASEHDCPLCALLGAEAGA